MDEDSTVDEYDFCSDDSDAGDTDVEKYHHQRRARFDTLHTTRYVSCITFFNIRSLNLVTSTEVGQIYMHLLFLKNFAL